MDSVLSVPKGNSGQLLGTSYWLLRVTTLLGLFQALEDIQSNLIHLQAVVLAELPFSIPQPKATAAKYMLLAL